MSMKWLEDVRVALIEIGGEAQLSGIYAIVKEHRTQRKEPLGNYQFAVRLTLQAHSEGKGEDLFELIQAGSEEKEIWKLKDEAWGRPV